MFEKSTLSVALPAIIAGCAIWVSPALAKHPKPVTTNIFTPPTDAVGAPSFNKNKTAVVPQSLLDGNEEPRWDIIKSLPDMTADQTKSINKLQQETQKTLAGMRTQMNEAQQELNELKAHKTSPSRQNNPAIALLNPDGKPYMGPLLGTEEMGMDPGEESMEDVQAQIDGLKEKIKETDIKAANQAKTLLSQGQLNELEMMRQGRLVVAAPKNALVDSPSEPSSAKSKKHDSGGANNAGGRVLRTILSGTTRGIRILEQI